MIIYSARDIIEPRLWVVFYIRDGFLDRVVRLENSNENFSASFLRGVGGSGKGDEGWKFPLYLTRS